MQPLARLPTGRRQGRAAVTTPATTTVNRTTSSAWRGPVTAVATALLVATAVAPVIVAVRRPVILTVPTAPIVAVPVVATAIPPVVVTVTVAPVVIAVTAIPTTATVTTTAREIFRALATASSKDHLHLATVNDLAVQTVFTVLSVTGVGELNKTDSPRFLGVVVQRQINVSHWAVLLCRIPHILRARRPGEVADQEGSASRNRVTTHGADTQETSLADERS
mmetsp:Transcript_42219/g.75734  ORF Transcript_42219/g.75734 Transcript_42219/m.75734 type:complete len:222 (+) Transcript_42219:310-975(+)